MPRLTPHPDFAGRAVAGVSAAARRRGGVLTLRYRVEGVTPDLVTPAPSAPRRADDLWRHTCFEAFVRPPEGPGYMELNLSPSTAWAAYGFDGYRSGMTRAEVDDPRIRVAHVADGFELAATVHLPEPLAGAPWRVGLSAVIEASDGGRSYWALAHPPGRPDFHHPDCFALELAAPDRS